MKAIWTTFYSATFTPKLLSSYYTTAEDTIVTLGVAHITSSFVSNNNISVGIEKENQLKFDLFTLYDDVLNRR